MQPNFAPITILPSKRRARRFPVAGSLVLSVLAGAIAPTSFAQTSRAAEVAKPAAAEKQAPLLVGLRRQSAVIGAVTPVPPAKPQAEAAKPAIATVATSGAPVPPARPSEYAGPQAAEAETPNLQANAGAIPLPPARPAELSATPVAQAMVDMPLPPARPDGLGIPMRVAALPPAKGPEATKPAETAIAPPAPVEPRRMATRETFVPATPAPAEPSFFDRLFGRAETPGPDQQMGRRQGRRALAYAATESSGSSLFGGSSSILQNASPHLDRQTAVYDISSHTVYLPDGTRLEAHSGLREYLDDPHHVHLRMRGATPPNVYELTPREALFHGVEALRLNPIAGHTYGRAGLLAHTFMLGPNGDSNGCVSFRDYGAFLRAYKSGMIRRLAVVAHR